MFKIFRSFYSNSNETSSVQNIENEQSKEIKVIVNSTISSSNIKISNPQQDRLTERVKSKMGSMLGVVSSTFGGIATKSKKAMKEFYDSPKHYIKGNDSVLNKTELMTKANESINQIDSQLGEIYQKVLSVASYAGNKFYPELTKIGYGLNYILPDQQYFTDIIEVNLSKIFVNLINQVESERSYIPNFDKQPMWLNMIIFVCRDIQKDLRQQLTAIEKEYHSDIEEFAQLKKELFPEEEFDSKEVNDLIKQCISAKDWDQRVELIIKLFPNEPISFHAGWDYVENKKIQDFLDLLLVKEEYDDAIQSVFSKASAVMMEKLLPNRIDDLELPEIYKTGPIAKSIYSFIESNVTTLFVDVYLNDKKSMLDTLSIVEFGMNQLEQLAQIEEKKKTLKNACGGGELFCNLSKTISSDFVNQISDKIIHKEKTLHEILVAIGENNPSKEMIEKMENYLKVFVDSNDLQALSSEVIADIYFKSFAVNPHPIVDQNSLKLLTKQFKNSLRSFEDIANQLQKNLPVSINLESFIISQLQEMLKGNSDSFKKNREITRLLIEGVLLNVFLEIARKNPSTTDKSTEVIFIENALNLFSDFYFAATNSQMSSEDISKEFSQILFQDLLGLDQFLPPVLLKLISDKANHFTADIQNHFSKISSNQPEVIQVKEELKQYGIVRNADQSTSEVLINDLMAMVLPLVLDMMTIIPEEESEIAGVSLISNQVQALIESYVGENFETAKVLLNYADKDSFKNLVKGQLLALNDPKFDGDKNKIVENFSNFLLVPLNQLIKKTVSFGGDHQKQSLQKAMGSVFAAGASHFDLILKAKKHAALEGRDYILHKDVVAVGDDPSLENKLLHPAVPREQINYKKTIDLIKGIIPELTLEQEEKLLKMIKKMVKKDKNDVKHLDLQQLVKGIKKVYQKELTDDQIAILMKRDEDHQNLIDVIKVESIAHDLQRKEHAFNAASKVVLKLMFPNGLKDLTFVSESQRQMVWNLLENQVLPIVFPILVEALIDPVLINKILLKVLQNRPDAYKAEINANSIDQPKKYNIIPEDQLEMEIFLGKSLGDLVSSLVNILELPPSIKGMLIDPKTGTISSDMQELLGSSLVEVFNEEFITSSLMMAIASAVDRDEQTGDFALKYNGRTKNEKINERRKINEELKSDIKKNAREAIKAYLNNIIRTKWAQFQFKLEGLFSAFGICGTKTKVVLDAICRFVFFKLIGSILTAIYSRFDKRIDEAVFKYISLDKNLDIVSGLFGDLPKDQPDGYEYNVYNENLVYQMVQALNEVVLSESGIVAEVVAEAMDSA